jgi:UDP-glucose:glycoprotein glucosyltransferase
VYTWCVDIYDVSDWWINAISFLLLGSEQQQYEKCIGLSKKYLGSQQLSLLKLSLSLSSLSPLIQAHLQIANEVHQDCETDAFVHFSEKIICTPNDLKKHIENVKHTLWLCSLNAHTNCWFFPFQLSPDHTDDVETYSFDHYYPGTENNSRTAILYGLIGTVEFRKFHVILKKAVDGKKIKYVARHFIKVIKTILGVLGVKWGELFNFLENLDAHSSEKSELLFFLQSHSSVFLIFQNDVSKKLRLSGYGVELHLKSTEYKSQDDSPRSDVNETADSADNEEAEVAGFDFELLKWVWHIL